MAATKHTIHVCTRCRGGNGQPGLLLLGRLQDLLAARTTCDLVLGGVGCMAGCDRPLTVGFSAPGKASYLFGDIDPDLHAQALLEFADLYTSLLGGWCNEGQRPAGLAGKIIARIPAPAEHSLQ